MSGDLRAGRVAGRLQRTLAMRMLRVASASALALAVMLLWRGAELSPPRAHDAADSTALSTALAHDGGPAVAAAHRLASTKAARSARVGNRHEPLVRSRPGEGDGDSSPISLLAPSRTELLADVADLARAHLRWLALGHAPYGEPSPFDATAPPIPGPRNG